MFQQSQTRLNKPNIIDHVTSLYLELNSNFMFNLSHALWLFVVVAVTLFPGIAATSAAVLL
jgi:hypothetical protein